MLHLPEKLITTGKSSTEQQHNNYVGLVLKASFKFKFLLKESFFPGGKSIKFAIIIFYFLWSC